MRFVICFNPGSLEHLRCSWMGEEGSMTKAIKKPGILFMEDCEVEKLK